jgi:hypothetical protein
MRRVSGWRGGLARRWPTRLRFGGRKQAAGSGRRRPSSWNRRARASPAWSPRPRRRPSSSRAHCARQQAASTRHWKITACVSAAMGGGSRRGGGGWRRASAAILYRCASARAQSPPSDPHLHYTPALAHRGAHCTQRPHPSSHLPAAPRAVQAAGRGASAGRLPSPSSTALATMPSASASTSARPAEPPSFEGLPQAALAAVMDLLGRADLAAAACACRAWRREAADDRCAGLGAAGRDWPDAAGQLLLAGRRWPAVGAACAAGRLLGRRARRDCSQHASPACPPARRALPAGAGRTSGAERAAGAPSRCTAGAQQPAATASSAPPPRRCSAASTPAAATRSAAATAPCARCCCWRRWAAAGAPGALGCGAPPA